MKWTFFKGSTLNTIAVFVSFLNNGLQFLTHLLNLAYLYSVSKQIFKLHYDTMGENYLSLSAKPLCVSVPL